MILSRREAVIKMALLMGASVVGPRLLAHTFDMKPGAPTGFSSEELALLDEIGETIIPATTIPGAKAVGIGAFIAMMVNDCYSPRDQAVFAAGLVELPQNYEKEFGETFLNGKPENRVQFLNALDIEQRRHTAARRQRNETNEAGTIQELSAPHYFRIMRELTILGYFSSEIGATQAVNYLEVPGRYDGDVPYKKGDPIYT
jgi:hypothetical protein